MADGAPPDRLGQVLVLGGRPPRAHHRLLAQCRAARLVDDDKAVAIAMPQQSSTSQPLTVAGTLCLPLVLCLQV